jgi:beta-lactamase class A
MRTTHPTPRTSPSRPRRRTRRHIDLRFQALGAGLAIAFALSAQSFASAREGATTYLIQPGETLSGIAAATGVSIDRLATMNGLNDPDLIVAGQILQLAGSPGAVASGPGGYTVKEGDTLWQIASSTGTQLDALISLNNLPDPDRLTVGQVLKLPPTGTAPSAALRAASAPGPSSNPIPVSGASRASGSDKPAAQSSATDKKPPAKPAATEVLTQRVISEARRVGGPNARFGVVAKNLVTGDRIAVNGGDAFPSASVMKLPILLELERETSSGALPWTESLRAQASAMITVSDNYAADQIADKLGLKAVNDTMARIGLSGTHFRNLFADNRSTQNPGFNDTTAADMARLLEMIASDQVLTPQATADMRGLLARNTDRSKLVRLLPGDARVAHKSGWYEGVANDVGIVNVDRTGKRWVIAVFTQNVSDAETGNQMVAAISRAVYDAWAADNG